MAEASHAPSRLPAAASGDLESCRCLSIFNTALVTFTAAGLVEVFLGALMMWNDSRLRDDVAFYGWGNVPDERFAIVDFHEKYAPILDYAPLILVGISFLVAMGFARRAARFASVEFAYSYRWTVIALFIPLLNIVRPWLGFAEIRRGVMNAAEGRLTTFGGFSYMTLALGLAAVINAGVQRAIGAELEALPQPETVESFNAYMDRYESLAWLSNGSQLVLLLVMCAYLVTVRTGLVFIADRARGRLAVAL
jgi:hypothetical protein